MHRHSLLKQLNDYARERPEEAETAGRIIALVTEHADCFDRACRPGHVTASAWVTTPDRQRHLLVHHRKLGKWLQPGGHADGDPDVAAVALREVEEETGLTGVRLHDKAPYDLDVHQIPARTDASGNTIESAHEHHDIRFLSVASSDQTPVASEESLDARWFSEDEVRGLTDETSVLRLLDKALGARTASPGA